MFHNFCFYSYAEGHLLAIINKAVMNMDVHVFLLVAGASFGYMPRSGIAVSSGNTMFNFLGNRQTDFHSDCTSS